MPDDTNVSDSERLGDHGPIKETVIHAPGGDEIPAHQCIECQLKVAKSDSEGFEANPCNWVQNVATDGGEVREKERSMAFACPSCGTENPLYGRPSEFEKRVFSCEGCGENVLLEGHLSERPARLDTDTERGGDRP